MLAKEAKRLYNNTMMKTIHSFNLQPQSTCLWSADYRSNKVEINGAVQGLSGDSV